MVLCNQGCGTHLFIKDGRPHNIYDKKPHVCPVFEMAKMFGGKYRTIPMAYIEILIFRAQHELRKAAGSIDMDLILKLVNEASDNLLSVTLKMEEQDKQNTEYASRLDKYKDDLVKQQQRREERKREKIRQKGIVWTEADDEAAESEDEGDQRPIE